MRYYLLAGKNVGISTLVGSVAGAGIAEAVYRITGNEWATSIASTLGGAIVSCGGLVFLNWLDNKAAYKTPGGKTEWGKVIKDTMKVGSVFIAFDLAYLVGKPFLTKWLLGYIDPAAASLSADVIGYLELGIEIPLYRKVFKNKMMLKDASKLEAKVKKEFSEINHHSDNNTPC